MKQYEAQTEEKQEKVLRVEEANKTEEEQLSHPHEEDKKFDQKQSELSIYGEEEVLRFMEEQKILQGSGKVYHFIPAERNDSVRYKGRRKYLHINICGDEEENYE